jgi:hypothetical protein
MEYKASKGMMVKLITIGIFILFAYIGYRSVLGLLHSGGRLTPILIHTGILVFLTGIIVACYLFAPRGYSIEGNQLIVRRPFSNKVIPIDSIEEIRQVDKNELRGMIRTFGVGGLFGNYGKFYAPSLGNFTMYGTQRQNYVLIVTRQKKMVITPDDLELIEQVKQINL